MPLGSKVFSFLSKVNVFYLDKCVLQNQEHRYKSHLNYHMFLDLSNYHLQGRKSLYFWEKVWNQDTVDRCKCHEKKVKYPKIVKTYWSNLAQMFQDHKDKIQYWSHTFHFHCNYLDISYLKRYGIYCDLAWWQLCNLIECQAKFFRFSCTYWHIHFPLKDGQSLSFNIQ